MAFNDRDYTYDAIKKQLNLIQLHVDDGSALDAGCGCIQGKHLILLEGLAEEGARFALSDPERRWYNDLADLARTKRKQIEHEEWSGTSHAHALQCNCENLRGEERKHCLAECQQQ
jgi:hypothetical protein